MSKRRREMEPVEKSGKMNESPGIEEKRAKASSDAGEVNVGVHTIRGGFCCF